MARHAEPVALALVKGSDTKNPARYRDRAKAPKPAAGIGVVPGHLSPGAAVVWIELAPTMVDGVLTVADRIAWEALCELVAEMRDVKRDFSGAKYSTLVSLLARFGMTPADRAKVSVTDDDDKPANPFAEFN
jgi:phage terminase small subunit